MKYVIFSFNYPTLCRALRYIDEQWTKENSVLVYASMVSPLPEAIAREYQVIRVNGRERSKLNGVKGLLADCAIARDAWRAVKNVLQKTDENVTLVVFRDNEAPEATIIDNVFEAFGEKVRLWVIEEGTGIYARGRAAIKKKELKKWVYRLAGVSLYALENQPQGKHPKAEKVICKQPSAVSEKYAGSSVTVEKQIDIFVPEFNRRFASYAMGAEPGSIKYDYVFLTTPITDFRGYDPSWDERYDRFLKELSKIAVRHGRLLIKSHPRDYTDYSQYIAEGSVHVCSKVENSIPFECLNEFFGSPVMMTTCSSTCINASSTKPAVYVNKLLGWGGPPPAGSVTSGYAVCETYEDLERVLSMHGSK